MRQALRLGIGLVACGAAGCAAISGLDGLQLAGDASTDASVTDGARDARIDDGGTKPDGSPSCSQNQTVCPADPSGCCYSSRICGAKGCCTGDGGSCDSPTSCCDGLSCTTGGRCQTSCLGIGVPCQGSGSADTCCRGQGYCVGGACAVCVALGAACTSGSQCCSGECSQSNGICVSN